MYPSNPRVRECIQTIANLFPTATVLTYKKAAPWPHTVLNIPSANCYGQFSFTCYLMNCAFGPDDSAFKMHPFFKMMPLNNDGKIIFITLDDHDSTQISVMIGGK